MKGFIGIALAALVCLAPIAVQASTLEMAMRIQNNVPLCHEHPDYPWQGRVSGNAIDIGSDRALPVSFLGCFPNKKECEAWLGPAMGFVTGRLIYAKCTER
ncbi:hypothetical protein [Amorphus sp. 3PC139-8]|uniref:hypothetical protein n=1 Tax=Amorphus sp. 3PC139-8 TaxID=2735676 RepID=UPI00345D058B